MLTHTGFTERGRSESESFPRRVRVARGSSSRLYNRSGQLSHGLALRRAYTCTSMYSYVYAYMRPFPRYGGARARCQTLALISTANETPGDNVAHSTATMAQWRPPSAGKYRFSLFRSLHIYAYTQCVVWLLRSIFFVRDASLERGGERERGERMMRELLKRLRALFFQFQSALLHFSRELRYIYFWRCTPRRGSRERAMIYKCPMLRKGQSGDMRINERGIDTEGQELPHMDNDAVLALAGARRRKRIVRSLWTR